MWWYPEEKSEDEMRTSFLKFMTITISPVCEVAWLLVEIHMGTGRGEGKELRNTDGVDMSIKNSLHWEFQTKDCIQVDTELLLQ